MGIAIRYLYCLLVIHIFSLVLIAQEPAIKESALTFCSQNLFNFSSKDSKISQSSQGLDLSLRFESQLCDLVALQEVIGNDKKSATQTMEKLLRFINKNGRKYQYIISNGSDPRITLGYLYDSSKFELVDSEELSGEMPKLNLVSRGRRYIRNPLMIKLRSSLYGKGYFYVLNFHFKSKFDGWKDHTKTNFELSRMQMAEGIRQFFSQKLKKSDASDIFIMMGDRNTDQYAVSSKLLSGELLMSDFRDKNGCKIANNLSADCKVYPKNLKIFHPLLESENQKSNYTYRFKKKKELIDEIYLDVNSRNKHLYEYGVEHSYPNASDHSMIYLRVKSLQ